MNSLIITKNYTAPPFCEKEILRYAGCKTADDEISALLKGCIDEIEGKIAYKVCYREVSVKALDGVCDLGVFKWNSEKLALNLKGCERAIIFAATLGTDIDRAILKYVRISPSKALMLQAIGAERIEALCDAFCDDIEKEYGLSTRPRFSPGYGDLSIESQRDIFAVLDCECKIGLTLNDSLLMSPSKSVTAVVGICNDGDRRNINKCSMCNMRGCKFRGAL